MGCFLSSQAHDEALFASRQVGIWQRFVSFTITHTSLFVSFAVTHTQVSWEMFSTNPAIALSPDLVVKIGDKWVQSCGYTDIQAVPLTSLNAGSHGTCRVWPNSSRPHSEVGVAYTSSSCLPFLLLRSVVIGEPQAEAQTPPKEDSWW